MASASCERVLMNRSTELTERPGNGGKNEPLATRKKKLGARGDDEYTRSLFTMLRFLITPKIPSNIVGRVRNLASNHSTISS